MFGRWKMAAGTIVLLGGLLAAGGVPAAASVSSGSSGAPVGAGASEARACGVPAPGFARCHAIQLLYPSRDWHPGPAGHGPGGGGGGGSSALPTSGYYPGDLQSAYDLASAAASFGPGPSAPTIAIVDAYDDPYVASDLATYRNTLNNATDAATGTFDGAIPPLCTSGQTSGCVTFKKVNQSGGTSYPKGNTGWAEEISLDVDMVSAICPSCNITLVEAATSSFSNLAEAVAYAQSLHPAAITNSYGGGEFSSETSYNATYSATAGTAVTAATGDSGYGVEFPAASPGLTAVGGTSLHYTGSGSSLVWQPQTVWDSSSSSGAGSGCSAYEPMPSWQGLQGVYSLSSICTTRQVGDVSAVADPYTGVAVYDTYGEPGWMVFGGTSASTQIVGAVYGLAAGSGSMAPSAGALYPDSAAGGGPTPGLTPVLSGSNSSCGDYLCTAGTGELSSDYNGPTGLGTPDGIGAFTAAPASPDFSLSASPTSQTVAPGGDTSYTVTVTDSGGFTGSVSLSVSGLPSGATSSFSPDPTASSSTLSLGTSSSTPAGTYPLTITGTSGSLSHSTGVTLAVQSTQSTGSMKVAVAAGKATKKGPNYHVPITVTATDATSGSPLSGAGVTLEVYAGSTCSGTAVSTSSGTTASNGSLSVTFSTRSVGGWCALATVTDTGYSTGSGQTTFNT